MVMLETYNFARQCGCSKKYTNGLVTCSLHDGYLSGFLILPILQHVWGFRTSDNFMIYSEKFRLPESSTLYSMFCNIYYYYRRTSFNIFYVLLSYIVWYKIITL